MSTRVPTIYDYLVAARKVADGSDALAIAKLNGDRVAPLPKAAPANVTPLRPREPQARQGGLL